MSQELRINRFAPEIRSAGDNAPQIAGYASKFNVLSRSLGSFVERVDPKAFQASKADGFPGVVALFNHDQNMVLGSVQGGTLQLDTDDIGLPYVVTPPTTRADVVELCQRGDAQSSSFAFVVDQDDWEMSNFNQPLRTLLSVQLRDVSVVTVPAYPQATAGVVDSLAKRFDCSDDEIRSLMAAKKLPELFRRASHPTLVDKVLLRRQLDLKRHDLST